MKHTATTQNGMMITYKVKATKSAMYPFEIVYTDNGRKWQSDGYEQTAQTANLRAAELLKRQVAFFDGLNSQHA